MRFFRHVQHHAVIATAAICVVILLFGVKPLLRSEKAYATGQGGRYRFKRAERCLMQEVNRARVKRGLTALQPDKQLAFVARGHASRMAQRRSVFHDPDLEEKVTRWKTLGENSGAGRSCSHLTRSFLASDAHRRQMLGPFRFQGVGAVRRDGRLYVQQIFEARRDPGNIYQYP